MAFALARSLRTGETVSIADKRVRVDGRELFVEDAAACADPDHRLTLRVVAEQAWHALFIRTLFIPTDSAAAGPLRTTMPRRRTVTRSAAASASSSLCVIRTALFPRSTYALTIRSRSSASAGASTAVGSSSSSTRALR